MSDDEKALLLWHKAVEQGITLVDFQDMGGKTLSAAISTEVLNKALEKKGLEDTWTNIHSLGLMFFIEFASPGTGDTRAESYEDALKNHADACKTEPVAELLARLG